MNSDKQHPPDLTLRPGLKQQECAIAGCTEPPKEMLAADFPGRFCKPHVKMIIMLVAERNYKDFLRWLSQEGITGDPTFAKNEREKDARNCGIPGCSETEANAAINFAPYKQGTVLLCKQHFAARIFVDEQANEYRVLREMEPKARRQDPDRMKLRRAILAAAKHAGAKDYIKAVCQELQNQRASMPHRWLKAWLKKGFRVEQTNWFDAYHQDRTAKLQIQKYISRICAPKLRKPI